MIKLSVVSPGPIYVEGVHFSVCLASGFEMSSLAWRCDVVSLPSLWKAIECLPGCEMFGAFPASRPETEQSWGTCRTCVTLLFHHDSPAESAPAMGIQAAYGKGSLPSQASVCAGRARGGLGPQCNRLMWEDICWAVGWVSPSDWWCLVFKTRDFVPSHRWVLCYSCTSLFSWMGLNSLLRML